MATADLAMPRLPDLSGKVGLVTGSSRGIGRGLALGLARAGADVVVTCRHPEALEPVVGELTGNGRRALAVGADVTRKPEVEALVARALEAFGRLDVLVNNAGTNVVGPSEAYREQDWDDVLETNLKGVFLCCQAAARPMREQGRGRIINIASIAGFSAIPMRAAYCTSKAGVIMLTKVLGVEWAGHGITVNAVAPGYVRTELIQSLADQGWLDLPALNRRTPLGRLGTVSDLIGVVAFLASDLSSYVTGETICVDGGWNAYGFV